MAGFFMVCSFYPGRKPFSATMRPTLCRPSSRSPVSIARCSNGRFPSRAKGAGGDIGAHALGGLTVVRPFPIMNDAGAIGGEA